MKPILKTKRGLQLTTIKSVPKSARLANLGLKYLSLSVYCEQLATIRTLSLGSGCSPITSINSIDPTGVSLTVPVQS